MRCDDKCLHVIVGLNSKCDETVNVIPNNNKLFIKIMSLSECIDTLQLYFDDGGSNLCHFSSYKN